MSGKEPHLTDRDNPEWTAEDFARARPAHEMLPTEVLAAFPKTKSAGGRPRLPRTKTSVTLRLDPDVVDYFRAGGPGWQSRINAALAAVVDKKA